MNVKTFTSPNGEIKPAILSALKSTLYMMANEALIKEKHDEVTNGIIEKHQPISTLTIKPIESWLQLSQVEETLREQLREQYYEQMANHGFKAAKGVCPLLVASNYKLLCESLLIQLIGMSESDFLIEAKRIQFIDLLIKFLTSYATDRGIELNVINEVLGRSEVQIRQAHALGFQAALNGEKAIPAHNAKLMSMLEGRQPGERIPGEAESTDILKSFLDGWLSANEK